MWLNLYNGKAQKEHIDETVEELLLKNGWSQSFGAEFTRLGFGFLSVGIAVYVCYLELSKPFSERRLTVGILCFVYFIIQSICSLWKKTIEKNSFYIGKKNKETIYITSNNPKNTDKYEIKMTRGKEVTKITYTFPQVVDTQGVVHQEKLDKITKFIS